MVIAARRAWLVAAALFGTVAVRRGDASALVAAPAQDAAADPVRRGRPLVFPRDHGAHLGSSVEWWYATGWLGSQAAPRQGFQVTFFRTRTGAGAASSGRFGADQLLFAHAAITDLTQRQHHHAQTLARWNGQPAAAAAAAALDDARVHIGHRAPWRLWRDAANGDSTWHAEVTAANVPLRLALQRTQPLLLQGDAGFSRKGPQEEQASHYYSEAQLLVRSAPNAATGRAWLDHEWSDQLLHPQAVGWDWIGINLFDGSALTAFVLRRGDGSALWAGGSFRPAAGAVRAFAADAVRLTPERFWTSPASGVRYPLAFAVNTPAGRFVVNSLLDGQEMDHRRSTGLLYWEGLSELLDAGGRRVGLGYLELTGYGQRLRL
jgi:predicted secreted hydrolase